MLGQNSHVAGGDSVQFQRCKVSMLQPPPTRYARSGDVHIAYQVFGSGPIDLVFVMGWVSHLDLFWAQPRFARFLSRLGSFARVILFDKRGTGLSDRVSGMPTIEERMDDVRAVMDAAGSERAALLGISEGGTLCTVFAASYPERARALVLFGCYARRLWSDDYPWGSRLEDRESAIRQIDQNWGQDFALAKRAPSLVHDDDFRQWWARYLRMSASPGAAVALTNMNTSIDVRDVLPIICVPTLVIHRTGDQTISVENGRFLASHIPGARLVELQGDDHLPFVGDQETLLHEIEHFLTGRLPTPEQDRVLATVLVLGFESSPLGDEIDHEAWQERHSAGEAIVRMQLERFGGRRRGSTIGGVVATFDGPARAIFCAEAIERDARVHDLVVRAGIHAGEVERAGEEITGMAVEVARQISASSDPGEILFSGTVRDLIAGSGIGWKVIEDRSRSELNQRWGLLRLARDRGPALPPSSVPKETTGPLVSVLSRRESEVAALVARGMSNREIADALFIAPSTAERHVANIFNKLGFHSRSQIAAWAVVNRLTAE
jgi:pimeloyl-ACP methyl ester carboxylesterase/DNA-binding NarL/FixJ family response regulator